MEFVAANGSEQPAVIAPKNDRLFITATLSLFVEYEASRQIILAPRYTATGDPSAKNADPGVRLSASPNSGPYKFTASQESCAWLVCHKRQGTCSTRYSRQPPSRCRV